MGWTSKDIEKLKATGKIRGWSAGKQFVPRKKCIVCGEYFYSAPCMENRGGNSGKFCSRKCYGIYSAQQMGIRYQDKREDKAKEKNKLLVELVLTPCENCGNPSGKKFCNQSCYTEFRNKQERRIEKKCLNCGKSIMVSAGQHNAGFGKFCSSSCSSIYRVNNNKRSIYGNSFGGKREDLDGRYFRSRWEANYARYLNFLIKNGDVIKWEYESHTFYFKNVKRGNVSYTPDFRVYYKDGSVKWIEIKGYMNESSITKLSRMKKYYPKEVVEIFDGTRYRELSNAMKKIIPKWEMNNKPYVLDRR